MTVLEVAKGLVVFSEIAGRKMIDSFKGTNARVAFGCGASHIDLQL